MNRTKWFCAVVLMATLVGCNGPASSDPDGAVTQEPDESQASGSQRPADDPSAPPDTVPAPDAPAGGTADVGHTSPPPTDAVSPPLPSATADVPSPQSVRDWVIQLDSSNDTVRGRAADAIEQSEDPLAQCIVLMTDPSAEVRRGAAFFLLGKFSAGNAEVDQALFAALTDEDSRVRHIALQAVNELQGDAVLPAVDQLARMLDNAQEDKHMRGQIARRIGRLGPQAKQVLPTLKKLGRTDPDRDVRAACLSAVFRIADRDEAVPVFREVLHEDADMGLRGASISRLIGYDAITQADMPHLITILDKSESSSHRGRASEALAGIGQPALPALIERFDGTSREVRTLAILAVGRMGPAAKSAAGQLQRLLEDPDRDVRIAAEISLQRIQGAP